MDCRRKTKAGAFLTGFLVSFALVGSTIGAMRFQTPGYEYGRRNCGPATGGLRSYASCVACCMRGAQQEAYPPDEAGNCNHFCKRVLWDLWMST